MLLPIEGLVDLDALRGRLANPNFAGKAPPELARRRLAELG